LASLALFVGKGVFGAAAPAVLARHWATAYVSGFEFRPNDLDLPPTVRLTRDLLQNTRTNRPRLPRGLVSAYPKKGFV